MAKIRVDVDVASLHTYPEVFEACKKILDATLEVSKKYPDLFAQLMPGSKMSLKDDFKVDSLDFIDLQGAFEEVLGITIPDEELEKLTDFDAYAGLVAVKLGISVG